MKKNITPEENQRTSLIVPRESFKSKLIEQITKGKDLLSKEIKTEGQLKENESEYKLWNSYNSEFLKNSFNFSENEYYSEYKSSGSMIGVPAIMRGASLQDPRHRLQTLKERIEVKTKSLEILLVKSDLMFCNNKDKVNDSLNEQTPNDSKTVFIIHGHDDEMKKSVQLFLNRGDLVDIVLHEQPDKNRTIIEKLVEEGTNASYVIALLSPDDIQSDGTYRARQNVILEIGYFIGKLGRQKVKLLRKWETNIPSDLQGILYENYDNEGAWRIKLAKEMKSVGIPINTDKIISKF